MVDPHPLVKPERLILAVFCLKHPVHGVLLIVCSQLCELARVCIIPARSRPEFQVVRSEIRGLIPWRILPRAGYSFGFCGIFGCHAKHIRHIPK